MAYHRITKRGRLLRLLKEHYLRDDIPCGLLGCSMCGEPHGGSQWLSSEPANGTILLVDTNIVLHQMDLLEAGSTVFTDVVVLQTVAAETRHRNASLYSRLVALMRAAGRRIVPFANEHHRQAFVARRESESPNDYNDRAVRTATLWYQDHLRPLGLRVLLLTDDVANAKLAAEQGLSVASMRQFVAAQIAHPGLVEMMASAPPAPVDDEDVAMVSSSAGKPRSARAHAPSGSARGKLYDEHWPAAKLAEALKTRSAFQGSLRVNKECWFEARVAVHGISGRASSTATESTGGDDVVSVLISGRSAINRAMEGDTVVIELLPRAQWRQPSDKLVVHGVTAVAEEREVAVAERLAELEASTNVGVAPAVDSTMDESAMHALRRAASEAGSGAAVPTGKVVGILKRAWRQYCGSIEPDSDAPSIGPDDGAGVASRVLFVPMDMRIPRIRFETRQRAALQDKRLVVAIDAWDAESHYPRGHYVRTLGPIGDKTTETECVLLEHDIPARPFSAEVLACLPPADWKITPEDRRGRQDLRGLVICSIDPPGCKDIDDALHARWLGNGHVEVGVHIADVGHFVKVGTAIDEEASLRANTTYLVERRLDMLPGLLTETLCSLKGGVERFAFSVTWEFRPVPSPGQSAPTSASTASGAVPDCAWEYVPETVKYFKSIICSQAAMTYAQAQDRLDDATDVSPVTLGVKLLASVARSLRRKRADAGALTLASAEVKVTLNETHDPMDVKGYELRETNSLVEEFMLLGNVWVGRRVTEAFPRCSLLRRHPAPPIKSFDNLLAAAKAVGVTLQVGSSKELADSLDQAVVASNPYFNKLLRILATRCMMQAVYFSSSECSPAEYAHYGLAMDIYTHFTSPIRRYADVVVHRLLAAALCLEPLPPAYEDRLGMKIITDNMNKRHLNSQLAGRASVALHTNIFFQNRVVVETALVMKLRSNGVVVLVPRYGLEGTIILGAVGEAAVATSSAAIGDSVPPLKRRLEFDSVNQTLCAAGDSSGALKLRVFDEVKVALFVEERGRYRRQLAYRLISPPFDELPADSTARASLPVPAVTSVQTASAGKNRDVAAANASAPVSVYAAASSQRSSSYDGQDVTGMNSQAATGKRRRGDLEAV